LAEPNRHFSNRLRLAVGGINAYGGSVGVYWPDGTQRRQFYVNAELSSDEAVDNAIVDYVQTTARDFRLPQDAYWSGAQDRLRSLQLAEAIQRNKLLVSAKDAEVARAKQETEDFIDSFDEKVPALEAERDHLKAELDRAEGEIARLTGRLSLAQSADSSASAPVGLQSQELDHYEHERLCVVVDALRSYLASSCHKDSRREHIVQDLINQNTKVRSLDTALGQLKVQFQGFRTLTPAMRSTLNELGFDIDESGPHVKLTWFDDERYTFTLAKSGSDARGGANSFADLRRLMF